MQAEQRLHPLSILFRLGAQVRTFGIPGLLVLVTAGSAGWEWQIWTMPLIIPFALWSIVEYASFRYRFDPNEMVIRTGFLFRNERHVPYARIQNLHAVQGVFHRLLGMVEVRVETGGAEEPEATMSVLAVPAFDEMRRRVFREREEVAPAGVSTPSAGRTVLFLPARELMLYGLIQNRGFVVIAAFWGVLWELGLLDGIWERFFGEDFSGRGAVRAVFRAAFRGDGLPAGRIALAFAALLSLLIVARLCSMGWALVRLYGFRLTQSGDDLHTVLGLLTRIKTAIPIRRIQTLTVQEGPLHRLFDRVSVKVSIAGGKEDEESSTQREWLAPILPRRDLPSLLETVLPGLDPKAVDWRGLHPRAFSRELKGWIFIAALMSLPFLLLKWWALALLAVFLVWAYFGARQTIRHLGWAVSDDAILFRSGWLWRNTTVVRFPKIQAVAIHESPFDRRAAMASVAVDTAGAGQASHRVNIPYLARETARNLCDLLAGQADRTAFRW